MLKRNAYLLVFLLCSLTLWCRSTSAGSSFLSPNYKPQSRGKSSRVGRQMTEELGQPIGDNDLKLSAPFELGITFREQDFEEYGAILQGIIQRLLGETQPPDPPNSA